MLKRQVETVFFSVVIPLYNKQDSVLRAISSVLDQSYKSFELIVINDGSSDNSLGVVEGIGSDYIRIFSQPNRGVSAARNAGVQAGSSDYICFLDADDAWDPDFLAEIAALIEVDRTAALFCARYDTVDENGKRFSGACDVGEGFFGALDDFFLSYAKSRSLICSSNVCINRGIFEEIGGFPLGVIAGEDIHVWLLMALQAPVMFSSKILATVYRDAENRTAHRVLIQTPHHLKMFLFGGEGRNQLNTHSGLRKFIVNNAVVFAVYAALKGDDKEAFKYFKVLITLNPLGAFVILLSIISPKYLLVLGKSLRNFFSTDKVLK